MFILIIFYASSFWVTECTPNPGRSSQHLPAPMHAINGKMTSLSALLILARRALHIIILSMMEPLARPTQI